MTYLQTKHRPLERDKNPGFTPMALKLWQPVATRRQPTATKSYFLDVSLSIQVTD